MDRDFDKHPEHRRREYFQVLQSDVSEFSAARPGRLKRREYSVKLKDF
jgi:hypothetical protein